jgi:hypothetical protein
MQAYFAGKRESDCETDLRNVTGEQWKGLATCWADGWELVAQTNMPVTADVSAARADTSRSYVRHDLFGWVRTAFRTAQDRTRHRKLAASSRA